MKLDDQNMDEQFRKMAGETQFPYKADFWKEVETHLADDSMDAAFRQAAMGITVTPAVSVSDAISDAYLDESFNSAAVATSADYKSSYWQEFLKQEANLEQDVAFNAAANAVTADYHAAYWSDADLALQQEGLHYEYKTAYWNEARQLLDRSDRAVFFLRWSAVAAILLLISIGSVVTFDTTDFASETASKNPAKETQLTSVAFNQYLTPAQLAIATSAVDETNIFLDESHVEADNGLAGVHENLTQSPQNRMTVPTHPDDALNTGVDMTINADDRAVADNSSAQLNPPESPFNENQSDTKQNQLSDKSSEDELAFTFAKNQILLNISEFNAEMPASPLVEIQKLEVPATHQFSFLINAGVGNRYSKIDFVPSLRTSFGVEYMHKGYGKLTNIEFGASLTMNHARQNDFGTERRVNVYNTDGGVDKFWYKLQLKDMIYTNLSGIASIKLDRKQNVRLSFGVDYLMFVQSNMSYQIVADQGITTVNNNWGVKEGLSKFDLRMGLGYEYEFSQRFSAQLNANLGFMDRTDDQFIDKSFFDQEMSVTAGVKYTFLRKS